MHILDLIALIIAAVSSVLYLNNRSKVEGYLATLDQQRKDVLFYLMLGSMLALVLFGVVSAAGYTPPNSNILKFLFLVCLLITLGGAPVYFIRLVANYFFPLQQVQSAENEEIDRTTYVTDTMGLLEIPEGIGMQVATAIHKYPSHNTPANLATGINALAKYLPTDLIPFGGNTDYGQPWGKYVVPNIDKRGLDIPLQAAKMAVGEPLVSALMQIPIPIAIPEEIRTQHHHIVAGTGQGKSECIKGMVLEDIQEEHSIVLIDSQGDLISELATRVPPDRLILVDPVHCPPALNLFRADTSSELFEYIFSALDAQMTSKQATAYRFVSRMVVEARGNIHTMRKILEPGDYWKVNVSRLNETGQSFFQNEFASRQFAETRQQILRRLFTLLENETLERMLGATDNRLDVPAALDSGKVILVSTAKDHLKQMGSSLFGRIFIAQVMQAVMSRKETRKRTYLYIDEAQDYAEDSHVLFNIFEQGRKYGLGIIWAHQYLGQLPPQLQQSLAANTAIKFAGGVSPEDARKLASQMGTTPEFIREQPKGTFAASVQDMGAFAYQVELGRLSRTPELSSLSSIRDDMRKRYGVVPSTPSGARETPKTGEVPEAGEW